jgi:hypothetical protein
MTSPHLYRVSALASGLVRMWRGWRVLVPVIVVNAVVQALLVWPPFTYSATWWVVLSAVISALMFGVAFGLVASTALQVPDGHVGWGTAVARLRAHVGAYALWAVVWLLLVSLGLALYTIPGLVFAALLPFLLLATLDGQRNPIATNFRTIGRRFWRWLLTVLIVGLALVVGDLAGGLFTFFTRNPLASLVVWLLAGFGAAWVTTAWALVYRSAWSPAQVDVSEPTPDLEPA